MNGIKNTCHVPDRSQIIKIWYTQMKYKIMKTKKYNKITQIGGTQNDKWHKIKMKGCLSYHHMQLIKKLK